MIEDKKLGLKITENPLEELWTRVIESTKARINELENIFNFVEKAVIETAEKRFANLTSKK